MRSLLLVSSVFSLIGISGSAYAATALSGLTTLAVFTTAGADIPPLIRTPLSFDTSDFHAGLSLFSQNGAIARQSGSPDEVRVASTINALWSSENSGSLRVDNTYNIERSDPNVRQRTAVSGDLFNPTWEYVFKATSDGFFTLSLDETVGRSPQGGAAAGGAWDWDVLADGVGASSEFIGASSSTSQTRDMTKTISLTAGVTYDISLRQDDPSHSFNVVGSPGLPPLGNDVVSQFNWVVTEAPVVDGVPEPGEWGLLITGCGLVGLDLRRRRRRVAIRA